MSMKLRPGHFRTLFRVLRPDECISSRVIEPLNQSQEGTQSLDEKARQHVMDGSSPNYRSSLVSFTSELNVALSFGGILSRIAVIDPQNIDESKTVYLDK